MGGPRWIGVAAALVMAGAGATAGAQTLDALARRSAAAASGATRTYTNDDLPVKAAAPPVPASAPSDAAADEVPSEEPVADARSDIRRPVIRENAGTGTVSMIWEAPADKPDEKHWRSLIGGLRARISKTAADIQMADGRLQQLEAGPATPAAARERQPLEKTLARLRHDAQMLAEELSMHLGRAAAQNVPRAWTE